MILDYKRINPSKEDLENWVTDFLWYFQEPECGMPDGEAAKIITGVLGKHLENAQKTELPELPYPETIFREREIQKSQNRTLKAHAHS